MYNYTLSLTSALDGVDGQLHAPAALIPRNRPGAHWMGDWVDTRAGLDGCGKSRLPPPLGGGVDPRTVQPAAIPAHQITLYESLYAKYVLNEMSNETSI
jgi:hypothetical protein